MLTSQPEGRKIISFEVPTEAADEGFIFLPKSFPVMKTPPATTESENVYSAFMYFPETKVSDNFKVTVKTVVSQNPPVYVNFTFNPGSIKCQVDVVPYTGVWLDPIFGVNRD